MDLSTLISQMVQARQFEKIMSNRLAQFGRPNRQYLGATLLPERTVPENMFTEDAIKYRTLIANSGTRYSPVQMKGRALIGSFQVALGDNDIGAEFTSREYDGLLALLGSGQDMASMASLMNWFDTTINLGLIELDEVQRWQAIVSATVRRKGANKYNETVNYSDPSNHRRAAAAAWSTDSTDPFDDMFTTVDLLASKGYTVSRIICGRDVASILAGNDKVKARVGRAVVNPSGQITSAAGRATFAAINATLSEDGLPPLELYDLQYQDGSATSYFLPRATMVFVATTGRDEAIDLGETEKLIPNTLGYLALGRAAGQSSPGRTYVVENHVSKPPRITAEGWQTSLPVITEPEAIGVIHTIS